MRKTLKKPTYLQSLTVFALLSFIAYTFIPIAFAYDHYDMTWMYPEPVVIYDNTEWDSNLDTASTSWNLQEMDPYFSITGSPPGHDIQVRDVYKDSVGWIGYWTGWHLGGYWIYADIQLNDYYMDEAPVNQRIHCIAHELGHGLGLKHWIGEVLMNPYSYTSYGIYLPQEDDVDGINDLYG